MDEQAPWAQRRADSPASGDDELRHAMELLFFAYRDFTGEADAILADYGMGRAHHRTIYFIGANSGISVSELLTILKITKQSLNRVLSTLIDEGYVVQETDDGDRRRRLMHLTPKGRELEQLLARRQSARIARAYRDAGPDAADGFRRVLFGLINEADRHRVTASGEPART
ncbi:MAG: MarR family transcriptional regulator [Rhodospirillales bacterium CG15_BIG_FIL_POST_REV_8_21_14_020_66_15]|nr:MAG: MarR family transcriptional regulator [Rhodospirillales bacterium CG15_BIG_FIL_POST_REV_8_21_14_020_66_15]